MPILASITDSASNFFYWFSGGEQQYHTLFHCLNNDTFWIASTVVLDIVVAIGYLIIARHWYAHERQLAPTPARLALHRMRNIFFFCGICGYIFIPIKMFYPAWRLYDIVMLFLAYSTWRYAIGSRQLKVIYNELGQSEKLKLELAQSRSETKKKTFFLNAISHDLRTPLNGLMLQTDLAVMSAEAGDTVAAAQALEEVRTSARAAAEMLNTLLEYARLDGTDEPVQRTNTDLSRLIREVLSQFHAAADEKKITLSYSGPSELRVKIDGTKLERLLSNLVSNAVKFTSQGGVRVEANRRGTDLEIHVIDSGVGIAAEHRDRLFEEFYQVSNHERDKRKGFGLGLSIARQLAEQLGGRISVESTVGRGSRFSVALHDAFRAEPAPRAEPEVCASASAVAGG